jgi:hypothetical protein
MRPTELLDRTVDRTGSLRTILAASSIAAGVIHAAVVPEHLEEAWVFGVFFLLAAGFQFAWAIPVTFRPSAIAYATGALANGALIGIWIISRTAGVPIGPDAWMPEPAGALDIGATLLELVIGVGSVIALRQGIPATTRRVRPV